MRVDFIQDYDISKLIPADYNPRKLEADKFQKLKESLRKFGIIKPLIVNGDNGVLTAGHQRTRAIKAVGIQRVPVIRICGIKIQDEIRFNLFHNSIETNKSKVKLDCPIDGEGYRIISHEAIKFKVNENASVTNEIGKLILRYGEWGSIVADTDGNVILNSDYAVASKLLKTDVICYVIDKRKVGELMDYMRIDYGEYNYDSLGIKSYNQFYCQMHRLNNKGKREWLSSLYERYVIPSISKDDRVLDFGAGKCGYAEMLKEHGYRILPYEPNYQTNNRINLSKVVNMIDDITADVREHGLYDAVVLDSVLNSVVNDEVENYVVAVCNSFLVPDGKLYVGTRNLGAVNRRSNLNKTNTTDRNIQFLDRNNFTATFRRGVWTMQHFHTNESLKALLEKYFHKVESFGTKTGSNIYAIAQYPKCIDSAYVAKALEFELNMEYPNDYRHNRHIKLKQMILKELENRNDLS